jgi:hypothetical protein
MTKTKIKIIINTATNIIVDIIDVNAETRSKPELMLLMLIQILCEDLLTFDQRLGSRLLFISILTLILTLVLKL